MPSKASSKLLTRKDFEKGGIAVDPVTDYAFQLVDGYEIACKHVIASGARHLRDLMRADKKYYFDVEAAQHALDFFPEVLRLSDGQFDGKPFILQPVQKFIVAPLFGW